MDIREYVKKRDAIVAEILSEYYLNRWVEITGDRSFESRPETIAAHHYAVGCLYDARPQTSEGREAVLRQLELLRNSLKFEYEKFLVG